MMIPGLVAPATPGDQNGRGACDSVTPRSSRRARGANAHVHARTGPTSSDEGNPGDELIEVLSHEISQPVASPNGLDYQQHGDDDRVEPASLRIASGRILRCPALLTEIPVTTTVARIL